MVQLAIRCHPRVPISSDELEGWLEIEVKDLHAQARQATVRLSRLTQELPNAQIDIGWLIELELDPDARLLTDDRLTQALRDMRLLGLQPTLLAPLPPATHTDGQAV
jgi:hypothetical protein